MYDQILLILVNVWYTKNIFCMSSYTAFFVIPMVCSIPEARINDYFWLVYNWYMAWWYMYNNLFCCCDCCLFNDLLTPHIIAGKNTTSFGSKSFCHQPSQMHWVIKETNWLGCWITTPRYGVKKLMASCKCKNLKTFRKYVGSLVLSITINACGPSTQTFLYLSPVSC